MIPNISQRLADRIHKPKAGPNDQQIGARIRQRRLELRRGLEWLGDKLGLTWQQVAKYEKGGNRISAARLLDVAIALEVPVAFFYEGLGAPETIEVDNYRALMNESYGPQLVEEFLRIVSNQNKFIVMNVAKALAAVPLRSPLVIEHGSAAQSLAPTPS